MLHYMLSDQDYHLTNPGGNSTSSAVLVTSRVPTLSRPDLQAVVAGQQAVGDGIVAFGQDGMECPKTWQLVPICVGGGTFTMIIFGWRVTKLAIGLPLWTPIALGVYSITSGTATGVAGADLGTTTLFPTMIASTLGPTWVTSGPSPVSLDWYQISPGGNAIGMIMQASLGFRYLECVFNVGTVLSCNALYCKA